MTDVAQITLPATPFTDLLAERYSVRAFTDRPVTDTELEAILTAAQRTPSWSNTQAWHVRVLRGDVLVEFGTRLQAAVRARGKETGADLPLPGRFTDAEMARKRETGYGRYEALGIDRNDPAGRTAASMLNFAFFGAPVGLVLTTTRSVGPYGWVDAGGYIATLQYTAWSAGMGACALGSIGMQADRVREYLGIGDDEDVVAGLALGWPDHTAPGNQYRTRRAGVEEIVTEVTELR